MVSYPLDPPLAKMVCTGLDLECGIESITIVAVLAVGGMQQVFFTPSDRAKEASEAHNHLLILDSDHLSLLNVFEEVKTAILCRARPRIVSPSLAAFHCCAPFNLSLPRRCK